MKKWIRIGPSMFDRESIIGVQKLAGGADPKMYVTLKTDHHIKEICIPFGYGNGDIVKETYEKVIKNLMEN